MGFTNQTSYLGLPQWVNDDKPSWLTDMNNAFAKIDENAKTQGDNASMNETNIDALQKSDASQNERLTNIENKQRDFDTDVTQLNEDVNQLDNFTGIDIPLKTTAQNLSSAINEISEDATGSNVDEIIEQIGVRYNGTTGNLMVYSNGEWKNYGSQTINENLLYDNGTYKDGFSMANMTVAPASSISGGITRQNIFANSGSCIIGTFAERTIPSGLVSDTGGMYFQPIINMNDYSSITTYFNVINTKSGRAGQYCYLGVGTIPNVNSASDTFSASSSIKLSSVGQNVLVTNTSSVTSNMYCAVILNGETAQSATNSVSCSMQILSVELGR